MLDSLVTALETFTSVPSAEVCSEAAGDLNRLCKSSTKYTSLTADLSEYELSQRVVDEEESSSDCLVVVRDCEALSALILCVKCDMHES